MRPAADRSAAGVEPAPPTRRSGGHAAAAVAAAALALALAPWLWSSGYALTLLSQIGIAVIACASYRLLYGEGGLLSFGHAVHSGLGAFCAMRVLQAAGEGRLPLPVSLVPLAGALAGAAFALVAGVLVTRHSGTAFAMITLGLGELVAALALMLPDWSGGEAGLSGNRVVGPPVLGISFGPQRQVYGLIAVYCLLATTLLWAYTRTPLGRLLNAVRDDAERVAFLGHDPRRIRWAAYIVAGAAAGLAGGLAALQLELVSSDLLSLQRSALLLVFVVLGGAGHLLGAVIGAVLMVLCQVALSGWTPAWQLYVGLLFIAALRLAPGGLAGLLAARRGDAALTPAARAMPPGLRALRGAAGVAIAAGAVALVELGYRRAAADTLGRHWQLGPWQLDSTRPADWAWALLPLLLGAGLWIGARRRAGMRA